MSDESEVNNQEVSIVQGDNEAVYTPDINGEQVLKPKYLKSEAKQRRNKGLPYLSPYGKFVSGRKPLPLTSCYKMCCEKISENQRNELFNKYWSLGTFSLRVTFLSGLMIINEKKYTKVNKNTKNPRNRQHTTSYFVEIRGERVSVCQRCFKAIFNETERFLKTVTKYKLSSPDTPFEKRGKPKLVNCLSDEKIKQIKDHIESFPTFESHYSRRDTTKKYLNPDLNISLMHRLFCDRHGSKAISLTKYSEVFKSLNLSFKKPASDTCQTCDKLHAKIKISDVEQIELVNNALQLHQEEADYAYESKRQDKDAGRNDTSLKVFAFDLQKCLPTPMLTTSVAFYKRPLWMFNLTVHNCVTNQSDNYMWSEDIGMRGGNEIGSALFKHIGSLQTDCKSLIFYSDNCTGQNKNSLVASMFMLAVNHFEHLTSIEHKFLISGHTHMECDSDHGLIERRKKKTTVEIHHPRDWIQFVRTVCNKKPFNVIEMNQDIIFDFGNFRKEKFIWRNRDEDGIGFKWRDVQWFKFEKDFGRIKFKTSLKESEPFRVLNVQKRGVNSISRDNLKKCYNVPLNISAAKKKDLVDLLPFIDPSFHAFYKNLSTSSNDQMDVYPDTESEDETVE